MVSVIEMCNKVLLVTATSFLLLVFWEVLTLRILFLIRKMISGEKLAALCSDSSRMVSLKLLLLMITCLVMAKVSQLSAVVVLKALNCGQPFLRRVTQRCTRLTLLLKLVKFKLL